MGYVPYFNRKSCSNFMNLMQIRDQLGNTSNNIQSELYNILQSRTLGELGDQVFMGASGLYYRIRKSGGNTVTFQSYEQTGLDTNQAGDAITVNVYDDEWDDRATDIMQDLQNGVIVNEALSQVSDLLMRNFQINYSDAVSCVRNVMSNIDADTQSAILNFISNASARGKISQYGWITAISTLCNLGKQASTDTFELDQSSPFVLQGIVSCVLSNLTTVATAITGVIAAVVGGAFQALIFVSSYIFGPLFNAIGTAISNECSINVESDSPYVKGPLLAISNGGPIDIGHEKPVIYAKYGVIDVYRWQRIMYNANSDSMINAFLALDFDFDAMFEELKTSGDVTINFPQVTDLNGQTTVDIQEFYDGVMRYITSVEKQSMPYNYYVRMISDKYLTHGQFLLSLGLMQLISTINPRGNAQTCTKRLPGTSGYIYKNLEDMHITNIKDATEAALRTLLGAYVNYCVQGSGYEDFLTFGANAVNTVGTGFVCSCAQEIFKRIPISGDQLSTYWQNDSATYLQLTYCYNPITALEIWDPSDFSIVSSSNLDKMSIYSKLDYIPSDRLLTIPDISATEIIVGAVITGIALAAVAITVACTSKVIKSKIRKWQYDKKGELKNKRKAYDRAVQNYGANSSEAKAAWTDFDKSQRGFNLKCKVLGLRTYDALNDWYNDTGSGYSIPLENGQYLSTAAAYADSSAQRLSNLSDKIDAVQYSITGTSSSSSQESNNDSLR